MQQNAYAIVVRRRLQAKDNGGFFEDMVSLPNQVNIKAIKALRFKVRHVWITTGLGT